MPVSEQNVLRLQSLSRLLSDVITADVPLFLSEDRPGKSRPDGIIGNVHDLVKSGWLIEDRVSSLLRPDELSSDDEADAVCTHFEAVVGLVQNLTTLARLALERLSMVELVVSDQPFLVPNRRASEFRNAVLTTTRLLGQLDLMRLSEDREYAASCSAVLRNVGRVVGIVQALAALDAAQEVFNAALAADPETTALIWPPSRVTLTKGPNLTTLPPAPRLHDRARADGTPRP